MTTRNLILFIAIILTSLLLTSCGGVNVEFKEGDPIKKLRQTTETADKIRISEDALKRLEESVKKGSPISEDGATEVKLVGDDKMAHELILLEEKALHLDQAQALIFSGEQVSAKSMSQALYQLLAERARAERGPLNNLKVTCGALALSVNRPIYIYAKEFVLAEDEVLSTNGRTLIIVAEMARLNGRIVTTPLNPSSIQELDAGDLKIFAKVVETGTNFEVNLSGADFLAQVKPVPFDSLSDTDRQNFLKSVLFEGAESPLVLIDEGAPESFSNPKEFSYSSDDDSNPYYLAFEDAVLNRMKQRSNRVGFEVPMIPGTQDFSRLQLFEKFNRGEWNAFAQNLELGSALGIHQSLDVAFSGTRSGVFPRQASLEPNVQTLRVQVERPMVRSATGKVAGGRSGRLIWVQGTSSRLDFRYYADAGMPSPGWIEQPVMLNRKSANGGIKNAIEVSSIGSVGLEGTLRVSARVNLNWVNGDSTYSGENMQKFKWRILLSEKVSESYLSKLNSWTNHGQVVPSKESPTSRTELQAWSSGYAGQWSLVWSELKSQNLPYFDETQAPFSTFKHLADLHEQAGRR